MVNDNDINSLEYGFQVLKKNIFQTLNVCLPAVVTKYDPAKNTVDVQPAIQSVMKDNSFMDLPPVFTVPVISLGGNGLSIRIPLKEGDTGIIICADTDITLFIQELKNTQPQTLRRHDLADCFFIPSTFGKVTPSQTSDIVIQNDSGSVAFVISSSGISIKGDLTVEGEIKATKEITATNALNQEIPLTNHAHTGVQTGGGTSGGSVPTPA